MAGLPRVRIDPNVRIGGGKTYAAFHDITGAEPEDLPRGTPVEVYEEESGLAGPAVVASRDFARDLIYLTVDWPALRVPAPEPWPWLVTVISWLVVNWRAFQRARCRPLGHKDSAGRFAWPPIPGRFAADARCVRCGVIYSVNAPLGAVHRR